MWGLLSMWRITLTQFDVEQTLNVVLVPVYPTAMKLLCESKRFAKTRTYSSSFIEILLRERELKKFSVQLRKEVR